ncbi:MAG: hypothetical protein ACI9VI_003267 [Candidatus Azotimanducaceae bacterium]|jgi:hypothetical protein
MVENLSGNAFIHLPNTKRIGNRVVVLRQQLATLKSRNPRPNLSNSDRLFWVVVSHLWGNWYAALHIANYEN